METNVISKEYDYLDRQKAINNLCAQYPFLKRATLGKSCMGKDITALKVGTAPEYCLMVAGVHGSERITSTILLMYIEQLCRAIKNNGYIEGLNAQKGLNGRGVIFVPCLNPDGCDISLLGKAACGDNYEELSKLCKNDFTKWNANARGVDINHNFNADWEQLRIKERKMGIYGPAPTRFGGYKPHSEPETLAIVNLCKKVKMRHTVALHSQGEVIYWTFGNKKPVNSQKIAQIMATSSGYALDVPIGIANGGGLKDWFIEKFNKPGFTIELGRGENPLPPENAFKIYKTVREMLLLCSII